jgi:hypothetical protein
MTAFGGCGCLGYSATQLEWSLGACPFLVEHDDMESTAEQWRAVSVQQAAAAVIEYLEAELVRQRPEAKPHAPPDPAAM